MKNQIARNVEVYWMLVRTDEAGNSFLVKDELTREEARDNLHKFSLRGHKQTYTTYSYTKNSRASLIEKHKIFV